MKAQAPGETDGFAQWPDGKRTSKSVPAPKNAKPGVGSAEAALRLAGSMYPYRLWWEPTPQLLSFMPAEPRHPFEACRAAAIDTSTDDKISHAKMVDWKKIAFARIDTSLSDWLDETRERLLAMRKHHRRLLLMSRQSSADTLRALANRT